MRWPSDIVVYDRHRNLRLLVEVKALREVTAELAAQYRRNLLAHDMISSNPYFLIATPQFFYLWPEGCSQLESSPAWQVAAADVLGPAMVPEGMTLENLSHYGLEMLVTSWLYELIDGAPLPEPPSPGWQWLVESGLYRAVRGGSVAIEAAV